MRQVFYCAGCKEWKPLIDATEVEAAFYAPLPQGGTNPASIAEVYMQGPKWRRMFQPILLCPLCIPVESSCA